MDKWRPLSDLHSFSEPGLRAALKTASHPQEDLSVLEIVCREELREEQRQRDQGVRPGGDPRLRSSFTRTALPWERSTSPGALTRTAQVTPIIDLS
jgi:hypothetical protein